MTKALQTVVLVALLTAALAALSLFASHVDAAAIEAWADGRSVGRVERPAGI